MNDEIPPQGNVSNKIDFPKIEDRGVLYILFDVAFRLHTSYRRMAVAENLKQISDVSATLHLQNARLVRVITELDKMFEAYNKRDPHN